MSLQGYRPQSEFFRRYYEEGVRAGRQEGRKEILLMAIEAFTDVLGVEFSAERRETLNKVELERLEEIYDALRTSRQWPTE